MINKIICGDCLEVMKDFDDNSIEAIITDPPYGISFMNKKWDYQIPSVKIWQECLRVLKPGGHLLWFCGTRTKHRMAVNIEDAGFEIRDLIAWVYSTGFPKSLDIGKAIDKSGGKNIGWFGKWLREWRIENNVTQKEIAKLFLSKTGNITGCVANWELGLNIPTPEQYSKIVKYFKLTFKTIQEAEREIIGNRIADKTIYQNIGKKYISGQIDITAPAIEQAKKWDGWGSALKPAMELITMARKPLSENNIASNVLQWGTGGINIDGCRIGIDDNKDNYDLNKREISKGSGIKSSINLTGRNKNLKHGIKQQGRWPANLIHDGSDEVLKLFPETTSGAILPHHKSRESENRCMSGKNYARTGMYSPSSQGSAARFFYCAKEKQKNRGKTNFHPTIKPIKLIQYLVKLVIPPDGIVLDPFAGSGTTGLACRNLGFDYILIEKEQKYINIINKRLELELFD